MRLVRRGSLKKTLTIFFSVAILFCLMKFNLEISRDRLRNDSTKPSLKKIDMMSHSPAVPRESFSQNISAKVTQDQIPVIIDGLPWSRCAGKVEFLSRAWKTHSCYVAHGANGSTSSSYKYLSDVEGVCPGGKKASNLLEDLPEATSRDSFDKLYEQFGVEKNYKWVKERITMMSDAWLNVAKTRKNTNRKQMNIHIHMGLLEYAMGAQHGGPLGELVQWSDLIAGLYVLGHNVSISQSSIEMMKVYNEYDDKSPCPPKKLPFHLLFTDILGARALENKMSSGFLNAIKCRIRVLDSFGTEAMFNIVNYSSRPEREHSMKYGGLELDLKQFYTMFPHSPDNTFLGFVLQNPDNVNNNTSVDIISERNIALIYGKDENYFANQRQFLDQLNSYFPEIHTTVAKLSGNVPSYVINHGVLPLKELYKLYKKVKVFVGLGFPYEGPAPIEAIANGAFYLNPTFKPQLNSENTEFFSLKPTRTKMASQNPYSEIFIGKPYVYSVDINNHSAVEEILRQIKSSKNPKPYLPFELTFAGMLERADLFTQRQDFCRIKSFTNISGDNNWWPPLEALKVALAPPKKTCNDACGDLGLICEPSFFQAINRNKTFTQIGVTCEEIITPIASKSEIDYPGYQADTNKCFLQSVRYLFSCADRVTNVTMLCPCRDFIKRQTALCSKCV